MARRSSKGGPLPNHREAAILGVLISGPRYGLEIRDAYTEKAGQRLPLGSLYTTLDRMIEKGFIKSKIGDSKHPHGGNRRRYYSITGKGVGAVEAYLEQLRAVESKLAFA